MESIDAYRGPIPPPEAAETMFRGLLESAPDAIIIVDRSGRIALVNQQVERVFGYDRAELLGQFAELLIPERLRPGHVHQRESYYSDLRARPMGAGLNLYGRRKDGSEFPAEISLSPMASQGEVLVITIIRDVTARHELERQKDEFIANVSHDLRTPLAGIKASIGVVLANEPAGVPEPLHRMFVNIELAADRMAKLVDDLLELARLRAGRVPLQLRRCDLRELSIQAAGAIEPLAQSRGQRVEVVVPPAPLLTRADSVLLERVVMNLLANAHVHGRDGGFIRLSLEPHGDQAWFAVADDGPGIPLADQARLFERFYRSEKEGVRMSQGSGLGLPIAKALVELHGGRIWVESRAGTGATFWVALPIEPSAAIAGEDGEA